MSRNSYIFAGPPGSTQMVMSIVETALGRSFVRPAGSDPYIRADPLAVYLGGHDFDDEEIYFPAGTPIALKTTYPNLIDIRDTERSLQRQQDAAARIFAAIKADGRIKAVYVDDVQQVLDSCDPHPPAARLIPPPSLTSTLHTGAGPDGETCAARRVTNDRSPVDRPARS